MDMGLLGTRVAQAREAAGMTQRDLGRAINIDRSAISRLENGERKLNVAELVEIAATLGRPLAYFVAEPVAATVSRRRDSVSVSPATRLLDVELEHFAADVRRLLQLGVLPAQERTVRAIPKDHVGAEDAAAAIRAGVSLGVEPIADLGRAAEALGLYSFAAPLGLDGADGGCVEVENGATTVGAAVVNGDAPAGRRRMTLAHELGHWVFGDAYDSEASLDNEKIINSFAIHFLAPRAGVVRVWNERVSWASRDRALAVGAVFRLSWSATVAHLRNLGIIEAGEYWEFSELTPTRGDYLRLGLAWEDELGAPYLSPGFAASVLSAFSSGGLTAARSVELLRGTLEADQLPSSVSSIGDLRRSFAGHDG